MLRIRIGGGGGEDGRGEGEGEVEDEDGNEVSERAVSMVSALTTSILVVGRCGQVEGQSRGRLSSGWKRCPVGGACGAEERREGRRSLVSVAMSERRVLVLVEGSGGGGAPRRRGARRSGKRFILLGGGEGAS